VTCQSANAATVTAVVQALPTVSTTSPVARCGVGAVTLSASAAGGTTTAMTYIWKVGAAAQITTAASSYTAPDVAVGSTTYSVTVRNDNGCVSSSAAAGTITVTAVPTITLTSGSSVQTVILGTAITQVKYTTANASSVTVSNLPSGVTGAWASNVLTISGTPTAAGVNGYTVTTANGNSCSNTTASGAIVAASGFSSSSTWSYASLAWSDVVVAEPSNCTKTNTFSLSGAPTQYKVYNGRYYYTWACATGGSDGGTNAELCPSPWRLPTKDDFINLDKAFGGSGSSRSETRSWIDQYYVANWGADYGGYGSGSSINNVKSHGYYWSSTETRNIGVYILFFVTDGSLFPNYEYSKYYGLQVRCVK
jgi:uncharacterized protein (TIGR02145 family)